MRASGLIAALSIVQESAWALPIPLSRPPRFIAGHEGLDPQTPLQKPSTLPTAVEIPVSSEDGSTSTPEDVEIPQDVPLLHIEVQSAECHPITVTLDGTHAPRTDGLFTAADGSSIRTRLSFVCEGGRTDRQAPHPLMIANAVLFVCLFACSIVRCAPRRTVELPRPRLPGLDRFFFWSLQVEEAEDDESQGSQGGQEYEAPVMEYDSQKYCFHDAAAGREKVLLPAPAQAAVSASMEEELAGFRDVVALVDDLVTSEKGSAGFD